MPRKYIFYLTGLMLLAVLGFYGYTRWSERREKVDLWTLVPEDAVFVVESTNHPRLFDQLRQIDLWENLGGLQSVQTLTNNLALLDSLSNRQDGASRFLLSKTLLSSVHVVSKKEFDFVFYIPVNTVGEHRFVRTLVDNIGKSSFFRSRTYPYQQHQVTEIQNLRTGDTFSFFTFHNHLVVSANGSLVKEIVRKINRGQLESPAAEYKNVNYLRQPEVFAQIFINYRHLPSFLSIFLKEEVMPDVQYLSSMCRTSLLGLKQHRGELVINGFSYPEPLSGSLYNQVKSQPPQPFELRNYLPVRTALLLHLGLSQPATVRQLYARDKGVQWAPEITALADSLARSFGQEVGVAYLQPNKNQSETEKVLFARSDQPARSLALLQALASEAGGAGSMERYGPYALRPVPVNELPMLLFGSLAKGFERCYVAQVDSFLLFAPDAPVLRSVLADIRARRVWSEVETQKALLEHTQQESNLSLFFNTNLIWRMLGRHVREQQRSSLLRHEMLIKKISRLTLQFGRKDDQYFTSFLLTHPDTDPDTQVPETAFEVQQRMTLPKPVVGGPWLVTTPASPNGELLLQDAGLILRRLRPNGETLWSDTLNQAITGTIHPVIFGSDNTQKYLFSAGSQIYCLDQNGRDLENFPFHLPDTLQVAHLAVVNFNHSQQPRLLVADQRGHLFLFDLEGNLQLGWDGKALPAPLAATPQLLRVNGRDVVVVLQKNGYITAFNTRGEQLPGFPIDLGAPLQGPAFGGSGTSLRQTRLTVVTSTGERVVFNLGGQILQRQSLPRGQRSAAFELISDPAGRSYIISRQEPGKISLYSQELRLLLEKNFITSSRKLVQYFDYGPLDRLYVLTETGPRKTYLYNYQAQLIGRQPVDNRLPVAVRFNEQSQLFTLFTTQGKEVQRVVFRDQ